LYIQTIFISTCLLNCGHFRPDSLSSSVDPLFTKWAQPDKPGCVVGIVRHDSLIYAKGFGLADLDRWTASSPQSIYYMASISKQFTGYVIALLVTQGKLHLDDDIHQYLPWVPDFGSPITIRNLLTHTSGIRDDIGLADITGLTLDGVLSQQQALAIIARQRRLNFTPGEMFSYSNSNYVLLAEIVRVVSGQSFETFTADHIFNPLDMPDSKFVADGGALISNLALSYQYGMKSRQNVYTLGDGGLFTNMTDMAHWAMHFYSGADTAVISLMTTNGKLNNGNSIRYAMGINVDQSRGWKRYTHGGSLAGYRTFFAVYPELKTAFILFGNAGDAGLNEKIDELEALFVPIKRTPSRITPAGRKDSTMTDLHPPEMCNELTGDYIAENGFRLKFTSKDGHLWLNGKRMLQNESADTFSDFANPARRYVFHRDRGAISVEIHIPAIGATIHLQKFVLNQALTDKELVLYTGMYDCPELGCSYGIRLKGGELYWTSNLRPDAKISLVDQDHLLSDNDYPGYVLILRDRNRDIVGFELNKDDILHLRFDRRR
jgi:CubicO group peptidase (beta-lactamase class C family)